MGFSWATDPGADVVEPSSGRKALGYVGGPGGDKPPAGEFNWLFQQVANFSAQVGFVFEGVGSLGAMVGYDLGQCLIPVALTISKITIMCPDTPASGTIEVELFKVTPGGSPVSLYSVNPLPTLTCNGGYAAVDVAAGSLPDTLDIPAGDLLIPRITNAPLDAFGIRIVVS